MTRDGKALLHVDGNTVEHAERFVARERFISLLGLRQGFFFQLISESVDCRIVTLDPFEDMASQLYRRNLFLANGFRCLQRRREIEFVGTRTG